MLYYPLYPTGNQTLSEGQKHFTSHCLDKLGSLNNKTVLDVGCRNGMQSLYILNKYSPLELI
jgi:cyclopropane fatty-acyl-phospholipid synthase-like methyltransferase